MSSRNLGDLFRIEELARKTGLVEVIMRKTKDRHQWTDEQWRDYARRIVKDY